MNYNKYKKIGAICTAALLVFSATGCSSNEADTVNGVTGTNTNATVNTTDMNYVDVNDIDLSQMITDRDKEVGYDTTSSTSIYLSDTEITYEGQGVSVSDQTVIISEEGTYILSGSLSNGQIVVDSTNQTKIQLVLDGVNINCNTSAAIYIKQADKVFITMAQDSENYLSNTSEFVAIDDNNIDAVIFSKDDLTLNGNGTLEINAVYGHGVVSKNDLVITSGTYTINAASHGLTGKDSVRISQGDITIVSGKDGIHSENVDDTLAGFVYIADGQINITCDGDGIDSSFYVYVADGDIEILAGGGSANAEVKQQEMFGGKGDQGFHQQGTTEGTNDTTTTTDTTTDTVSVKAIKGENTVFIYGGTITADAADDTIHSNGNIVINGGDLTLSTGDDGVHGDNSVVINDGTVTVAVSYEGIEGKTIAVNGGTISVVSSDDGFNAAGGNDASGYGGGMQQDAFAVDNAAYINITGGSVTVVASGDGIDSSGNLYISGGEIYVYGPENSGNGSLDYGGEAVISGGIFVAAGASGMAQSFSDTSTQGAMLVTVASTMVTGEVTLTDASGNEIISFTPEKSYNCVIISSPEIIQGETYTVTGGGQSVAVEMTSNVYGSGSGMGGGQMQGGGGQRQNRGEIPSDGTIPERGAMPQDDTMPEGGTMPEGTPPNGGVAETSESTSAGNVI